MANPNTFVKSADIGPIRRVATVHERQSMKMAADVYGYGQVTSDNFMPGAAGAGAVTMPGLQGKRNRLNEQQKQVMKVLESQSPEPTSPEDRDRLDKHSKILEAQIGPFLQTNKELRAVSFRDSDFMSALRKAREWSKPQKELGGRTPEQVAEDWCNIKRRLDPENPEADSLHDIRKER